MTVKKLNFFYKSIFLKKFFSKYFGSPNSFTSAGSRTLAHLDRVWRNIIISLYCYDFTGVCLRIHSRGSLSVLSYENV